jgi:hypothetical protein
VIDVNLTTYLKTGVFGGLRLGMTGQEVRAVLGEPQETSVRDTPRIWYYGLFQVALDENRVVWMAIYFEPSRGRLPKVISIKGWRPSSRTTIERFLETCAAQGVACRVNPSANHDDWVLYQLESGISVGFYRNGKRRSLGSLQLSDKEYSAARAALRVTEIEGIVDHLKRRVDQDDGSQ